MTLIMTRRMAPLTALILVPVAFGVLAGARGELGAMMLEGVTRLAPTGIMLVCGAPPQCLRHQHATAASACHSPRRPGSGSLEQQPVGGRPTQPLASSLSSRRDGGRHSISSPASASARAVTHERPRATFRTRSSASVGIRTAVSSEAPWRRARSAASGSWCFHCAPGRFGISDGALTAQAWPHSRNVRWSPWPAPLASKRVPTRGTGVPATLVRHVHVTR